MSTRKRVTLMIIGIIGMSPWIYSKISSTLAAHQDKKLIAPLLAQIHAKWPSVPILTDVNASDFLTKNLQSASDHTKVSPISTVQLYRILKIIPQELDKYPKSVVSGNLGAIGLCSSLWIHGMRYGGTNDGTRIYLVVRSGIPDEYLRRAIHHEFSSVLMHYTNFPSAKWRDALPKHMQYMENMESNTEIKKYYNTGGRRLQIPDKKTLTDGFVAYYGKSNLENDFNTYAELLFSHPNTLRALAKKYPRINIKYQIVLHFYEFMAPHYHWFFLRDNAPDKPTHSDRMAVGY